MGVSDLCQSNLEILCGSHGAAWDCSEREDGIGLMRLPMGLRQPSPGKSRPHIGAERSRQPHCSESWGL